MSENLKPACLKQKSNSWAAVSNKKNVFNARLNHSVDKSAERREDGRLFQILAPATVKLRLPNILLVRRTSQYLTIKACTDRSLRWADSHQQGTVAADRAATYSVQHWTTEMALPSQHLQRDCTMYAFCSCDFHLNPILLIYKLDLKNLKTYVEAFKSYTTTDRHTNTWPKTLPCCIRGC